MTPWRRRWDRIPRPALDAVVVVLAVLDMWFNAWSWSPLLVALLMLACVALVFRRRSPLTVFLLTLPATLLLDIVVAPLVALFTLAARSRDRRLLAACATVFAVVTVIPSPFDGHGSLGGTWTVFTFVYTLATATAPVLLGQLVQAQRDLSQRLVEIQTAKEYERELHAQTLLARERAQLAREMHDVVSHQVSLIAVQAGALQVAARDAHAQEAAGVIRSLGVATLDELRTMVTLLRASGGDSTELTPQPTLADLQRLVASSGIATKLSGDLPARVGTPTQRAIYRTVQEALTNVRKHAPGATATVELWQDDHHVGVTVTNTPSTRPSLPLPGAHHGLIGLQERADMLRGSFVAGPTAEGGYRVRVRLPAEPG
ncbi:sensor histidine kinase [Streptomyces sp. NPDC048288]|uniref:sensor histidine kinase n=1 Tax=Streptomyces sp. NPDC048288 TaxID=3365529 RepID=UPI00371F40CB